MSSRFDKEAKDFEDKPVRTSIKWGSLTIVVVVVLILVGGVAHFALGWLGAAADVAGPRNVKEQYATVIEDWNAMEAAAENACGAETAAEQGNAAPTLVEDPALAYKAKYRSIAVDFNRRQTNIFEGGLVGPSNCGAQDCPKLAPTLGEMQRMVGCG